MDMIERVARAISMANSHDPDAEVAGSHAVAAHDGAFLGWEIETAVARAALKAVLADVSAMARGTAWPHCVGLEELERRLKNETAE